MTAAPPKPPGYTMPGYVIDRVMKKRGRLRVFDHFAPAETALVVIDMQQFYVSDVPPAIAIVPNINRLAGALRAAGGLVAWVKMTAGRDGKSLWPLYHEYFFSAAAAARHRDNLTEGAPGHALYAALEVQPNDLQATKSRFSAFLPGVSDLPKQLAQRNIRNVIITGMLTNFCCETSARDAMMMDYRVVMVSDANAARFDEDHTIGFSTVFQSFGDVLTTEQVLTELLPARA